MASRRQGILLCVSFILLVGASSFRYEEAMGGSILLSGGWEREADEPFEYPRDGSSCPSPDLSLYNLPVIGIVSHPGDGASGRLSNASGDSNIPASYVKFVESAGARVIPLIYNEPEDTLIEKLNLVNGVLFTGGWAKTGLYYETIKKVFQIALKRNDAGEHFPLFAICLGFELLTMIISKDRGILERFHGENQASSLYFQNYSDAQTSVFERYFIRLVLTYRFYCLRPGKICEITSRCQSTEFPNELLKKLSTECLAMQNHKFGISPKKFQGNAALSRFFQILTTSKDENGKVYVSTVQAYDYPVTGFQWHPEKNAFEWGLSMIPHSEDAVRVTQLVANYFISEARKSSNRPPADKVLDNLIYNYSPTYCGRAGRGYDEVYIFNFLHSSM